jgi:hypothetical protein
VPRPPYFTTYNEFQHDFIEAWTDTNELYGAAAELCKLCMKNDNINTYIMVFEELAHKALYEGDDPAVLEIFKTGLPLALLEVCMHHNEPQSWDAWKKSARMRQAILTSLKTHQTNVHEQLFGSPVQVTPPMLSMTPPPELMQINKVYTIPAC